jgi:hypothetical protein
VFFLKLEGDDLERLFKLAAEKKGAPVERLARLAFLKGLRLLAKEADGEAEATRTATIGQPSIKSLEETKAYIRENWQQQTDVQLGVALGYGWQSISNLRRGLGLLRPRGRRYGKTSPTVGGTSLPPSSRIEKRNQKFAQLDALIREHWKTKNDWEIGLLLDPHVGGNKVRLRRYELGLKKVQGVRAAMRVGKTVREAVNAEEFERMVLREGYTMSEYLKHKKLNCTRERLRQIAEQMGLKHSPEDRTPEWELARRARKVGHLTLANRDWLAEKISHYQSMSALAAELRVKDIDLLFFVRSFKLSHPSLRKHGAETVSLVCTKCGTEFSRLKKWVDRRRKKANSHPQEFFCSQSCAGQWNRERVRTRTAKQLERERIRAKKKERCTSFIRKKWQKMSDAQMALALELSEKTIEKKRVALGFRRARKV